MLDAVAPIVIGLHMNSCESRAGLGRHCSHVGYDATVALYDAKAPMPPELVYSFGHYRLLPARRTLLAADQPVSLGGRALDLLMALVERSDRVVSKGELMEVVWPRLVVEENNLNVQIMLLRKLLGHPMIATVPGRGYRFALPVTQAGGAPSDSPPSAGFNADLTLSPKDPETEWQTNLLTVPPTLYGRDADLAAMANLLANHRLVTITGAGGIGKTRLGQAAALRAVSNFPDGVWWVELAPLSRGGLVAAAIVETLNLDLSEGRDPVRTLLSHLRSRRMLLVLDNCEQVLDDVAALVTAIHDASPAAHVLVTSQEVLRTPAENVYRLSTLSLPDSSGPPTVSKVAQSGAGALFLARAQALDSRFEFNVGNLAAVVEICGRLDGIPLAIELAVARLPLLGIEGLCAKLSQRFALLTGGSRAVLRRHQTLRAALEWSHDLLSAAEQSVFRRLGVFTGGFTLEAAQQVASDDEVDEWDVLEHLGALVDKSLIVVEGEPLPRYRFLETTRLFALERLGTSGEMTFTLERHARAMVTLIERYRGIASDRYHSASENARLALEADNVRAALDWLNHGAPNGQSIDDLAVELGGLAGTVLRIGSGDHEAFLRALSVRSRITPATPMRVEAHYWMSLARSGAIAGHAESLDAGRRGAALCAKLGDDISRFLCLTIVIAVGARRGAGPALESTVREASLIDPKIPTYSTYFLWARYRWLMSLGRAQDALDCMLEAVRIFRDAGMLAAEQQNYGDTIADCEMALGRYAEAETHCRDALAFLESQPGSRRNTAHVVDTLARALILQGKAEEGIETARRALQMTRNEGFHFRLLEPLALNAAHQGRLADAAWLTGHIDATYAKRGEVRWPDAAARRAQIDAALAEGLDPPAVAALRAEGALSSTDEAFARAFGDG